MLLSILLGLPTLLYAQSLSVNQDSLDTKISVASLNQLKSRPSKPSRLPKIYSATALVPGNRSSQVSQQPAVQAKQQLVKTTSDLVASRYQINYRIADNRVNSDEVTPPLLLLPPTNKPAQQPMAVINNSSNLLNPVPDKTISKEALLSEAEMKSIDRHSYENNQSQRSKSSTSLLLNDIKPHQPVVKTKTIRFPKLDYSSKKTTLSNKLPPTIYSPKVYRQPSSKHYQKYSEKKQTKPADQPRFSKTYYDANQKPKQHITVERITKKSLRRLPPINKTNRELAADLRPITSAPAASQGSPIFTIPTSPHKRLENTPQTTPHRAASSTSTTLKKIQVNTVISNPNAIDQQTKSLSQNQIRSIQQPRNSGLPNRFEARSKSSRVSSPNSSYRSTRILPSENKIANRQMEIVSKQALEHVRRGLGLAQRSATYSARVEFIQALRLVASARDAQQGGNAYSRSLAKGIRAIKESDDFDPAGINLEADLILSHIIASHQTSILKDQELNNLTPLAAREKYYTYAQQQLALAMGKNPAGSLALYGLGKLHTSLAQNEISRHRSSPIKAMAYHHAAVEVHPGNYRSANELGVLLARYGELEHARRLLSHSIQIHPIAETWHNLSVVHEQLGEKSLALQARVRSEQIQKNTPSLIANRSVIVWKTPEQFQQGSRQRAATNNSQKQKLKTTNNNRQQPKVSTGMRSFSLPWSRN